MDCASKQTYTTLSGAIEVNPFESTKCVALYFSAHWCPPCRQFTPVLAQFYNDVNANGKQLEIVFVSSDKSIEDHASYFATMPWISIPFNDARIAQLKTKHNIQGIPCLVVLKPDGSVLSENARGDVSQQGVKAFDSWVAASK